MQKLFNRMSDDTKQKMLEMQSVSDPNASEPNETDPSHLAPNLTGRSQSSPNIDSKENDHFHPMSIQISLSQGSVSPRATPNLSARITDSEGNLVFNRTESEQEHERQFSFLFVVLLLQIG